MLKLSELPLGEELQNIPIGKIARMVIDLKSQNCELTGKAAMQVNSFLSECAIIFAVNVMEREVKIKRQRMLKKEMLES